MLAVPSSAARNSGPSTQGSPFAQTTFNQQQKHNDSSHVNGADRAAPGSPLATDALPGDRHPSGTQANLTPWREKEQLKQILDRKPLSDIVRAFTDIYCDGSGVVEDGGGGSKETEHVVVRVLHSMSDLDQALLPQKTVDCTDDNNHVQHTRPIDRLIVLVRGDKIKLKDRSRLNRNDTLHAQLHDRPIEDRKIGARHLEFVPVHSHLDRLPSGNISDVIRREASLLNDLYQKLKARGKFDAFVNHFNSQPSPEAPLAPSQSLSAPQSATIDLNFQSPLTLTQNGFSIDDQGKLRFNVSQLAHVISGQPPGTHIHVTFRHCLDEHKKTIRHQIDCLNEQTIIHQNIQKQGDPRLNNLVLPPGTTVTCSFDDTPIDLKPAVAVIRGQGSDCDTRLNGANFRSHVRALGLVDSEHPTSTQLMKLKTALGNNIFVAPSLTRAQWLMLWASLSGHETIVIPDETNAARLPDYVRSRLPAALPAGAAPTQSETQPPLDTNAHSTDTSKNTPHSLAETPTHSPVRHTTQLQQSLALLTQQHLTSFESVITPDTRWEDLLHTLETSDDVSRGMLGRSQPSPLLTALKSGKPVHWVMNGATPHIAKHLETLSCQPPYLLCLGEKIPANNLTVTVIEDLPDDSVATAAILQNLLLAESFSETQVPVEFCEKLSRILSSFFSHSDIGRDLTFESIKRLVKQIKARYDFEIKHFYKPSPQHPLSDRLVYTAMRQAYLREFKQSSMSYQRMKNALSTIFCRETAGIDSSLRQEDDVFDEMDTQEPLVNKQLLKFIDAFFVGDPSITFSNEKEWLQCRQELLNHSNETLSGEASFPTILEKFNANQTWNRIILEQQLRLQKAEKQLINTVRKQPITVLLGNPGGGKTYELENVGEKIARELGGKRYVIGCHTGITESDILEHPEFIGWMETGGVMVFDEGNLTTATTMLRSIINAIQEKLPGSTDGTPMSLGNRRVIIAGNHPNMESRTDVIGEVVCWEKVTQYKHVFVNSMLSNLFGDVPRQAHELVHSLWETLQTCPVTSSEKRIFSVREIGSMLWRAYRLFRENHPDGSIAENDNFQSFKTCLYVATHHLFDATLNLSKFDEHFPDQNPPKSAFFSKRVKEEFERFKKELLALTPPIYASKHYEAYFREIYYCVTNDEIAHQYKMTKKTGKEIPYQKGLFITGSAGSGKDILLEEMLRLFKYAYIELKDVDLNNFEDMMMDVESNPDSIVSIPEINRVPPSAMEALNRVFLNRPIIATRNPPWYEGRNKATAAMISRVGMLELPDRNGNDLKELGNIILQDNPQDVQKLTFFHQTLDAKLYKKFGHRLLSDQFFIQAAKALANGDSFEKAFKDTYVYYFSLLRKPADMSFLEMDDHFTQAVKRQRECRKQPAQSQHLTQSHTAVTVKEPPSASARKHSPGCSRKKLIFGGLATAACAWAGATFTSTNRGLLSNPFSSYLGTGHDPASPKYPYSSYLSSVLDNSQTKSPDDELTTTYEPIPLGLSDNVPPIEAAHPYLRGNLPNQKPAHEDSDDAFVPFDILHSEDPASPSFQLDSGANNVLLYNYFNQTVQPDMITLYSQTLVGSKIQEVPFTPLPIEPMPRDLEPGEIGLKGLLPPVTLSKDSLLPLPTIGTETLFGVHLPENSKEPIDVVSMGRRYGVRLNQGADSSSLKTPVEWEIAAKKDELKETSDTKIKQELDKLTTPFDLEKQMQTFTTNLTFDIDPKDLETLTQYLSKAQTQGEAIWQTILFFRRNTLKTKPQDDETAIFSGYNDLPCRYRSLGFEAVGQALGLFQGASIHEIDDNTGHSFYSLSFSKLLKINLGGGYAGRQVTPIHKNTLPNSESAYDIIGSSIESSIDAMEDVFQSSKEFFSNFSGLIAILGAFFALMTIGCALMVCSAVLSLCINVCCRLYLGTSLLILNISGKNHWLLPGTRKLENFVYGEGGPRPAIEAMQRRLAKQNPDNEFFVQTLPEPMLMRTRHTPDGLADELETASSEEILILLEGLDEEARDYHKTDIPSAYRDNQLFLKLLPKLNPEKLFPDRYAYEVYIYITSILATFYDNGFDIIASTPFLKQGVEDIIFRLLKDKTDPSELHWVGDILNRFAFPQTFPWSEALKSAVYLHYKSHILTAQQTPAPPQFPQSLLKPRLSAQHRTTGRGTVDPLRRLSGLPAVKQLGECDRPQVLLLNTEQIGRGLPNVIKDFPNVVVSSRIPTTLVRQVFEEELDYPTFLGQFPLELYENNSTGDSFLTSEPCANFFELIEMMDIYDDDRDLGDYVLQLKAIFLSVFPKPFFDVASDLLSRYELLAKCSVWDTKEASKKIRLLPARPSLNLHDTLDGLKQTYPFVEHKDTWIRLLEVYALFHPNLSLADAKKIIDIFSEDVLQTSPRIAKIVETVSHRFESSSIHTAIKEKLSAGKS